MKDQNQNISEDFLRANLQGNATELQKSQLLTWLAVSDENQVLFDKLTKIWDASEQIQVFEQIDLKQDWNIIQNKRRKHSPFGKLWIKYAAAAVFIGFGLSFIYLHETTPGFGKLSQLKTETAKNEIQLADGSHIQLNAHSKLVYPNEFDADKRRVELEGEAFFNVRSDTSKAFIIESGNVVIKVLGTSFNVRNLSEDQITVSVNSGRVSLRLKGGDNEIVLTKGQVGQLKNEKLVEVEQPGLNYDSWRTGILKFKDTPFADVIDEIEKLYQVTIENKNTKLDTLKVTIVFTNLDLDEVLAQLKLLMQVNINKKGKVITIK